jgi:hypothetical protein
MRSRRRQIVTHGTRRTLNSLGLSRFRRKWRNATTELSLNSGEVSPMRKPRENDTPVEKVAEMGVVAGERLHYH